MTQCKVHRHGKVTEGIEQRSVQVKNYRHVLQICRKITKFLRHTQVFVQFICISQNFVVILHAKLVDMSKLMLNKIEYLVLLVAEFASRSRISEQQAYRYLSQYGALALCDKHYNIMHTLSVEENLQTIQEYCQRKGGNL